MNQVLVVLILVCVASIQGQRLNLHLFGDAEVAKFGARCLDGSPAGFYFGAATTPAASDKWYIFLPGGGYCLVNPDPSWINVQNCAQRATSDLGSSAKWGNTTNRQNLIPEFNQVIIPYCGGDLHTGTRREPQSGLYTAGHLNIAAVVQTLIASYNLSAATEVILAGSSAGGIGTFANAGWLQKTLGTKTRVSMYSNAGWFIVMPPYNPAYFTGAFQVLWSTVAPYLDEGCVRANPKAPWDCYSGNYTFPHLTVPAFVAQSIFDTNLLVNQGGFPSDPKFPNPDANEQMLLVGKTMNETLQQVARKAGAGIFSTSAYVHGVATSQVVKGQTLDETLHAWYTRSTRYLHKVMDDCVTPNCANIPLPSTTTTGSTTGRP